MWVILGAAAVVVVVVVVAVLRRPRSTDLGSVRKYHSALGTIEHLSERIGQTQVRVVGTPEGAPGVPASSGFEGGTEEGLGSRTGAPTTGGLGTVPGTGRRYPPVPAGDNGAFIDQEAPLVFDDSRPYDRYRRDGSTQGTTGNRADRAQRHALESMNRRSKRGTTAMVVTAVVVVVAALAYLGNRHSGPGQHSADASVSATSTSAVRTTDTSPPAHSGSGASHQGGRPKKPVGKTKSPPTTIPTRIVAVTMAPGVATYPVSVDSYGVTVTASGPCWVLARTVSSGSTLWTGTLQAGAIQTIDATGAITVELGAPSASLSVEHVPVVLPVPLHTPFVATFQPLPTASAGPGSATTTTPSPGTAATTG